MTLALALQRNGLAQALAEGTQVPHATVGIALLVAGGAAHVVVERQAIVGGIVEVAFTVEHRGGHGLGRHHADSRQGVGDRQVEFQHRGQVEAGNGTVHEVVHVGRSAVAGERHALRRAAGRQAHQLEIVHRVVNRQLAAGFEGGQQVARVAGECRARGDAGIVEVDAEQCVFQLGPEHDAGTVRPDGGFEGHTRDTAQQAGTDIVLFRRYVGEQVVERHHRRVQVVRQPGTRALADRATIVGEVDRVVQLHRCRVDHENLGERAGQLHAGGAFTRHRRGDEVADQQSAVVIGHREVSRHAAQLRRRDHRMARRIAPFDPGGRFEHDVVVAARSVEYDAVGLRVEIQRDGLHHRQRIGIDDTDGRGSLVGDENAVRTRRLGQGPGIVTDRDFLDETAGGTGYGYRVVVGVDVPDTV